MFDGFSHLAVIWIFVGLGVFVILFLVNGMARLYRKAGPHEALIVYGLGGTRVVKGHGTMVLPMVQVCKELSLELMSFDVAPQQDLVHQTGRCRDRGSRGADQSEVRYGIDSDRVGAIPHQDGRRAPGPDPAGDGRSPARHHRPAHGGRNREAA